MANSKLGLGLLISGLGVAGTGLLLGLFYAPSVSSQEWNAPEAYRIIFWHVPAAWTSFVTFGMLFVGSLGWMYLGTMQVSKMRHSHKFLGQSS